MDITRKAFVQYLTAHKDKVVGKPKDPYYCPIATFLKDSTPNATDITVTDTVEYLSEGNNRWYNRPLPKWGRDFIEIVDNLDRSYRVSGREALRMLGVRDVD